MNPILTGPKIDSDKPIAEQIQQIRSYLFRFKDELELILSCIDSDNVTEKFEEKMYDVFSRKFEGSDTMSQIIQTTSLIKMEVKGAVQMGADKYSSFAITPEGIKIKSTGTFTVDSGNFSINDEGDVSINGHVNALSGSIGGYKIESDTIRTNQPSAAKPGLALVSGVGKDDKALAIGFTSASDYSTSNFFVNGDGTLHATGAVISGTITSEAGGSIGGFGIDAYKFKYGSIPVIYAYTSSGDPYLKIGDDAFIGTEIHGNSMKITGFQLNLDILDEIHVWAPIFMEGNIISGISMLGGEGNATISIPNGIDLGNFGAFSFKNRSVSWEQITYIDDYGAVQSKYLLSGGNV